MDKLIYAIRLVSKLFFYAWVAFILYRSIKKCFWNEGKSKILLFIWSVFTSPLATFLEAFCVLGLVGKIFLSEEQYNALGTGKLTTFKILYEVIGGSIIYMALIFLSAWLTSKWFKVQEKPSVIFLYLMFNTILVMSLRGPGNAGDILDILGVMSLYLAVWMFYQYDIGLLAEMRDVHIDINWKGFNIPPAIFTFLYAIFTFLLISTHEMIDVTMMVTIYIFSTIIVFLYIWAFNAIIKNIKMTNEAIVAKNEVKTLSVEVMEALAHTIDAKDEYTRGHSVRVAKYSKMLAEKLGLLTSQCEDVYYMALLHDIGKIGVPNEIINSTTKLTDEQYDVIKTHPGVGFDILAEIKSRPDLTIGARWHHERYDGNGYPDNKKGDEIPFYARIIAVADSYDAMTSNRSYRKYMSQDKVRSEIEKNIGTQFDPDVAKCMLAIIDDDVNYQLHE